MVESTRATKYLVSITAVYCIGCAVGNLVNPLESRYRMNQLC